MEPLGTLARVPMTGGTPREVLEDVTYAGADFSPDGKGLAVAHRVDGKIRLEFPAGNVLVPEGVDTPRFSPDGKTIAFWDTSAGGVSLGLIDPLGKSKRSLTTGFSSYSGAPCWRPDGREVWVTAGKPGGLHAIWALDLSGATRLVMRVPGHLELDDIANDGRTLVAHHTLTRTVQAGTAAEPRARDLSWLDSSIAADLSADGKALVLNEDGEGAGPVPDIYLRAMDGSPAVRIGEGHARALSPDGKWVLAVAPEGGEAAGSLIVLPTGPGAPRRLDRGGLGDFGWASWMPDGRSIVFSASPDGGASRLFLQAVPDGQPRPISPDGVRLQPAASPVSPDGRFVAAVRQGSTYLFPIDGQGEPRAVAGIDPATERVIQWTSDGRAPYVGGPSEERIPTVWLLDLATGQRRLWKQIDEPQPYGRQYVRVTPDGSAWVYSAGQVLSELYLVEGLR